MLQHENKLSIQKSSSCFKSNSLPLSYSHLRRKQIEAVVCGNIYRVLDHHAHQISPITYTYDNPTAVSPHCGDSSEPMAASRETIYPSLAPTLFQISSASFTILHLYLQYYFYISNTNETLRKEPKNIDISNVKPADVTRLSQ